MLHCAKRFEIHRRHRQPEALVVATLAAKPAAAVARDTRDAFPVNNHRVLRVGDYATIVVHAVLHARDFHSAPPNPLSEFPPPPPPHFETCHRFVSFTKYTRTPSSSAVPIDLFHRLSVASAVPSCSSLRPVSAPSCCIDGRVSRLIASKTFCAIISEWLVGQV